MKYAIVKNKKVEAFKDGRGICPCCNSILIAKCGEIIINHWAHQGKRNCDKWWENETEWHRKWKNEFPINWQEIVHIDNKGEKHIADVKTEKGWVVEFQHSYLKPEERRSRNEFYNKIVWVIDGLRRPTDVKQFNSVLSESSKAPVGGVNILKINFPEESRLLKEWLNCKYPVFFDFYELNQIWFLLPLQIKEEAYVMPFSRKEFSKVGNGVGFDELHCELIPKIREIIFNQKKSNSNKSINSLFHSARKKTYRRRL